MSLPILLLIILALAAGLTYLVAFVWKKKNDWVMTFLQNYVGILFIISGIVKAVDPLGTAYKMEDYFRAFESLFEPTWFSFITPIFPFFSEISIVFSLLMIIFEIVLGIMLILGAFPKFTSWGFLLLILVFLVLTGYTYLTGYVPMDSSFWAFSEWAAFDPNNMKVTDCGCFGDFIKFAPFTSFMKDVFLMIPGLYFVIFYGKMHRLSSKTIRTSVVIVSTFLLTIYCFQNYYWNLPHIDFRPFNPGVNILERQEAEAEAEANVKLISWKLKSKKDGRTVDVLDENFDIANYPVADWEYLENVFSEPAIPHTKISDFAIEDFEGNDVTRELLEYKGMSLMIIAYKMPGKAKTVNITIQDTAYRTDTVFIDETASMVLIQNIDKIEEKEIQKTDYVWDENYLDRYINKISPFVEAASNANIKTFMVVGATEAQTIDFMKDGGPATNYYTADDILLKTIVRSNPGLVLISNGTIIDKWHWKKFPEFDDFSRNFKFRNN
jgi:uncharacterized membrane protein YphA (DoxX/SURF4 family)